MVPQPQPNPSEEPSAPEAEATAIFRPTASLAAAPERSRKSSSV